MKFVLILIGVIVGIIGVAMTTQITVGAALLVAGAIIFSTGVLVEAIDSQTQDFANLRENVVRASTAIDAHTSQLDAILTEMRAAQGDSINQSEGMARMEKLTERQIQLLEWIGEIEAKNLSIQQKP